MTPTDMSQIQVVDKNRKENDTPAFPESIKSTRLPAAERKRLLISQAVDTFSVRGFHATSMEDVAVAAGVTKPVIYQHFRSKRHLYVAILRHVGLEMKEVLSQGTSKASGGKMRLYAGMEAYFKYAYENATAYELLFGSGGRRDPEFRDLVAEIEQDLAAHVTSTIDVDLDPEHRELAAVSIMGIAEAVMRLYFSKYPPASLNSDKRPPFVGSSAETWSKRAADLAWAGLRAIHRD